MTPELKIAAGGSVTVVAGGGSPFVVPTRWVEPLAIQRWDAGSSKQTTAGQASGVHPYSGFFVLPPPRPPDFVNHLYTGFLVTAQMPAVELDLLVPDHAPTGTLLSLLDLWGEGFSPASVIWFDTTARSTLYLDVDHLQLSPGFTLGPTGPKSVWVVDGALQSAQLPFQVTARLDTLVPASGPSGTTITVNGAGFDASCWIYFDDNPVVTTLISATQVSGQIGNASVGQHNVLVKRGAFDSNSLFFQVNPDISSIAPASGNQVPFTLTVTGSGFSSTSQIVFDSVAQATTFIDSGHLNCIINILGPAGSKQVFVRDGSQQSNTILFGVVAQGTGLVIDSIVPDNGPHFLQRIDVSANEAVYSAASVIHFNGAPPVAGTNFIDATHLYAWCDATGLDGPIPLYVIDGAQTSNTVNFNVALAST